MSKTILVCGHGPGISDAVARKFGAEGFSVGLVARSADKLTAAAAALQKGGVRAEAFPTDLGDPAAVKALVGKAREKLGPIAVLHWNAYGWGAGDLTKADPKELHVPFDVAVTGLVAAVQASLPDLEAVKGAVLVTGGGFAFYDPNVDAMATRFDAMGLAISKAAQHKTVGLLAAKLAPRGIYVGEVVVMGMVKGTAFDHGNATLEASAIADKFWQVYGARAPLTSNFGG
jgi:NADP-dependent 3-hydroxy acid dehydrogenase YdfG